MNQKGLNICFKYVLVGLYQNKLMCAKVPCCKTTNSQQKTAQLRSMDELIDGDLYIATKSLPFGGSVWNSTYINDWKPGYYN